MTGLYPPAFADTVRLLDRLMADLPESGRARRALDRRLIEFKLKSALMLLASIQDWALTTNNFPPLLNDLIDDVLHNPPQDDSGTTLPAQ